MLKRWCETEEVVCFVMRLPKIFTMLMGVEETLVTTVKITKTSYACAENTTPDA
jgi:hypothetical protein